MGDAKRVIKTLKLADAYVTVYFSAM